jgi:pilus assembly protein Flp/PilA
LTREKEKLEMRQFVSAVKRFVKEEDAPTMVEYGLLVALIALVVAIAAALLGSGISTLFSNAGNSL